MKDFFSAFLALFIPILLIGQNSLKVDYKYAPDWYATSICFPDDTHKTLVGPLGQLLYDYGKGGFFRVSSKTGFSTVIQILPDEQMKFESQKLFSAKVPIVENHGNFDQLEIKQEFFAYSSKNLNEYGKKDNWEARKTAPREDIILSHITNNSSQTKSFEPLAIINSKHSVSVEGKIATITDSLKIKKRLIFSSDVTNVRQNLGDDKTLILLEPVVLAPGETKVIAAIYDNGIKSTLTKKLVDNPESTIVELLNARTQSISYWENESSVPFGHITIPDQQIQDLITSSLRNIWQAREIFEGKYSFQVGPTVYRGLWIVDGAFILEAATMVDKGADARDGLAYMLSFQEPNGKFGKMEPNYWKENGIVLWACVRHAMLTQDKEWLKSIWPKLSKTVDFIKEMRQMSYENDLDLDDGLIPPGQIDGGLLGADDKGEYTNTYWNLMGLKAIIGAADWIGEKADVKAWQKEYDDFYTTFLKAAERDMAVDTYGNKYLPVTMDPKYHSLPQRAQWAFCQAVYPGQLFDQDDLLAKGNMDMLNTTLQEGMVMGTGWIVDGIWNYFASFYGHASLWMGDAERAVQSLYSFANHASPLLTWREEHNPRDLPRHFVGDMPHNWASAEFIRLAVHLLAIDRGNELHLFEGLPKEWVKADMVTALDQISTPFGKLTFSLKVNQSGDSAILKIDKLSDSSCDKIVVHLGSWTTENKSEVIEFDPSKSHELYIKIK
ncbi:hypothetical protein MWU78_16610 [Arenibacter sp. F26102]|uniref:alpha-L-rhamnosidase-related protein n=1 Tax=Arenibacter sp. F26102 TaxID=2926416 RepID=UPI001FF3A4E8|nr:hypothetical protein [Arenibacter sp. F26102]MCK0147283.1 hypothetical protein [Arenibacter sp. F26102]